MKNELRTPLYVLIQDYIKMRIATGKLHIHDKLPSEAELMKQFNVSRITVSNALTEMAKEGHIYRIPGRGTFVNDINNKDDIREESGSIEKNETGEKIAVPDSQPGGSGLIGFIIPDLKDYFSLNILNGIKKALDERGHSLLIKIAFDKAGEEQAIKELLRLGVEGMVIFPSDQETYNDEILALKVNHYPFVLVDRYLPGVETNYVVSNNVLGGKLAASHLYQLGHRKIAICTSTMLPTSSTEERIRGYSSELAQRGVVNNHEFVIKDINISNNENNEIDITDFEKNEQLVHFLKTHKATAYIATDNNLAIYIYKVCKYLGIRIPEDISLVCFDDPTYLFGDYSFFTHILQSEKLIGYKAGQLLAEMLQNGNIENSVGYSKIVFDPILVIRKSSTAVNER